MTYGIELNNNFGERVLDFNAAFYKKTSGSCLLWPTTWWEAHTSRRYIVDSLTNGRIVSLYAGANQFNTLPGNVQVGCLPQIASMSLNYFGWKAGWDNYIFYPEPFSDPNTMVFYELDAHGITRAEQVYQPYHEELKTGVMAMVQPHHDRTTPLGYVSCDITPVGGHTETKGMQLRDAAGSVVFDSREPVLNIKDHITISEAQMADVIDNGATYDFPLRGSISNMYVCPFNFDSNDFIVSGSSGSDYVRGYTNWLPRLRKLNSSTLRLTREIYGMPVAGITGGPVHDRNVKEARVLIADV